jgi:archaellum component FlaC
MVFRKREAHRDVKEIKEAVGEIEEKINPAPHVEEPPLFIKIEKYGEMANNVEELKNLVSGLKQGLTILDEIEIAKTDAVKTIRSLIHKFEKNLIELDTLVVRPRGLDFEKKETDMTHIEDNLGDLQNQLTELKKSLKEFK